MYIIFYYIILYYIILCILYHIILYYIILYYTMLYYIILYFIILYYIILYCVYIYTHICVDVVAPNKIEDSKIPAKYGQIEAVLYLFGKLWANCLGVEILMKSDGTLKSCHFGFRRRPHPKMTLLLGSHLQCLISK